MGRIVVLDQGCCTGCGSCAELCPEVFAMDELNEKASVILPEGGDEKCIEEAMAMCPVDCISWENGSK
jgi:ferredoxin